jgi:hypothetical protein
MSPVWKGMWATRPTMHMPNRHAHALMPALHIPGSLPAMQWACMAWVHKGCWLPCMLLCPSSHVMPCTGCRPWSLIPVLQHHVCCCHAPTMDALWGSAMPHAMQGPCTMPMHTWPQQALLR